MSLSIADMSDQQQNARLNEVLIRILRGLLQYADECWPWTSEDESQERAVIKSLVAEQRDDVQSLVDLLNERGHAIEFGNYPTEYTDLHYVSLDYLLDMLVQEQQAVVADLSDAIQQSGGDAEARQLLDAILPRAQSHLDKLKQLAAERTASSST